MASWNEEILQALKGRDDFEKKDSEYFAAFAQLSQKFHQLSVGKALQSTSTSPSPSPSLTASSAANVREEDETKTEPYLIKENLQLKNENAELIEHLNQSTIAVERLELRISQGSKAKNVLEKQLEKANAKVENLTLRLKEKDKSIEIINDEILLNQIQVNVLRDKLDKVTAENESLIKRWMEKVRSDAEKLNEENAKVDKP